MWMVTYRATNLSNYDGESTPTFQLFSTQDGANAFAQQLKNNSHIKYEIKIYIVREV